jgi:hypothetical protein
VLLAKIAFRLFDIAHCRSGLHRRLSWPWTCSFARGVTPLQPVCFGVAWDNDRKRTVP